MGILIFGSETGEIVFKLYKILIINLIKLFN